MTGSGHRQGIEPGSRMPPLVLESPGGAGTTRLRDPARGSVVAVFLQSSDSPAARSYLGRLSRAAGDFEDWDGRVVILLPAGERNPLPVEGMSVAVDPAGDVRRRCHMPADTSAVVIADRWGQVYHAAYAPAEDGLPAPREITEWLRFIATQCPECGVPDEPGAGAWAP